MLFGPLHVSLIKDMPNPPVKYPKARRSPSKPPVRKDEGNGGFPAPGNDQNWKGMAMVCLLLVGLLFLYYVVVHPNLVQQDISQEQLFNLIKTNKVESVVNEVDPSTNQHSLTGTYKKAVTPNGPEVTAAFRVPVDLQLDPDLKKEIQLAGYKGVIETKEGNNWFWPLVTSFVPILFFVGVMYFLFRQQIRMAGKSAFSFGKSKARMMTRDRNKVTFKDVAGNRRGKGRAERDRGIPARSAPVPEAGRAHPQGCAHDRASRHGKDAAGQGHCGRSRRAFL